jgi:CRP-like cAMP-binding protein
LAIKPVFVASLARDDFNRLFDESSAIARFVLYMLVKEMARKTQLTLQFILTASVR